MATLCVGILSLKGNLILFVIIIFTFSILAYPHFINNIVLGSLHY